MTQFATLPKSKKSTEKFSALVPVNSSEHSNLEQPGITSLTSAIQRHTRFEKASFHTPGHKGRDLGQMTNMWQADLTELPGLDQLGDPAGVLLDLERRAARLWGARHTIISVNGASGGIVAAMLSLTTIKKKFLVPRNAHRSVINAMVIGGIEPIWFEPVWDARWGCWGAVSAVSARQALSACKPSEIAGMLVVSPTYTGAVSDIASIADSCHFRDIPLLVDEAHGAHFLTDSACPSSAIMCGADLTIHSLHKTLSALTQTGLIHINEHPVVDIDESHVRAQLNLVQSSSPSYPLLQSIESAIELLELKGKSMLARLPRLKDRLEAALAPLERFEIFNSRFETDPLHIMLAARAARAEDLFEFCVDRAIFPEAILGRGVLFLLGIGNVQEDIDELVEVLIEFDKISPPDPAQSDEQNVWHFTEIEQVISPRQAFMMPSHLVPVQEAVGQIAAECIAPCPPGIPVCVPGQRIHPEVMNLTSVKSLRVVIEPSIALHKELPAAVRQSLVSE